MPWLVPSIIATLSGTAILSFVYYYLYLNDRKTYLKIWAVSWFIYFLRYVFMIFYITGNKSPLLLMGNQIASQVSGVILLWGTYHFVGKTFSKAWFFFLCLGIAWIITSISLHFSFFIMSLPTFTFLAFVYILTGWKLITSKNSGGYVTQITGVLFIVWGLHKADYPFLRPVTWFAPVGYLAGAILEFTVALGILLIYFQKTRNDLKKERNLLQKAQEMGKMGSWRLNLKTGELLWTDVNYTIFGLPKGMPLTYETFLDCVHPEDRTFVDEKWKAALNKEPYDIEHRIIANGQVKWIREKAEAVFDHNDQCILGTGFSQDITLRKQAEEALRKSEKRFQQIQKMESIGNLAGGIAHDFNNLLFPIMGMSEMLLDDLPLDSPYRENVYEILSASKRASELVKQILAFSRQSEQKKGPVRIQQILKEVIKLTRSTIPSNIEIIQDIQPDCGLILADPTQIHQIAMNIITNAFHAVEDKGGAITITVKEMDVTGPDEARLRLEAGRYALLSISDTGHGIPADLIPKIFDPYFTTKEQGKGTGLGLAVVYGIVKEHQGDIKVVSDSGTGTAFHIYLPVLKTEHAPSDLKIPDDHQRGHEHILLVDDEEPIVKLEKQMLERLGYDVTSRFHSSEAFEAFKANPDTFDLVITDMAMPSMTGVQLAEKILGIRPDIPVIICTGFSERIDTEKAKSLGIRGVLMKPIVKTQLAQAVRRALDNKP